MPRPKSLTKTAKPVAETKRTRGTPAAAAGLPESSRQPSPYSAPPVPQEMLDTDATGLGRRDQRPQRVIVIGAGMAGLVAAFELDRQGHEPIVLEAQNRVGGRVYTMRKFAPGLYAEAGAMRIPRVHTLTLEYCKLFGLKELRYNASTKILFQVRNRFWEKEPYGIVGGTTATDLPIRPEGRLYFAGEHCSLYHAWIQGALESGIRAAREIHELPSVPDDASALKELQRA